MAEPGAEMGGVGLTLRAASLGFFQAAGGWLYHPSWKDVHGRPFVINTLDAASHPITISAIEARAAQSGRAAVVYVTLPACVPAVKSEPATQPPALSPSQACEVFSL